MDLPARQASSWKHIYKPTLFQPILHKAEPSANQYSYYNVLEKLAQIKNLKILLANLHY
jgi:hypothetical protein